MKEITFITGNPMKAAQLSRYLKYPVKHMKADVHEIQSLNLREVAEHKAREAQRIVGGVVLVEDVSLTFHALQKLPGPLIKWFLETLGNKGLSKLLDGYDDRSATAEVCFALCDGTDVHFFESSKRGEMLREPQGERLFGWDPVFLPEGCQKTWAEMTQEEEDTSSLRKPALEKLALFLDTHI